MTSGATSTLLRIVQQESSNNNEKFAIFVEGTTNLFISGLMFRSSSSEGKGPYFAKIQ